MPDPSLFPFAARSTLPSTLMQTCSSIAQSSETMKKKRKRPQMISCTLGGNRKRAKRDGEGNGSIPIEHPTLRLYYFQISTLQNYRLSCLPVSSRSRRRKVASIGRHQRNAVENAGNEDDDPLNGVKPPLRAEGSNHLWPDSERCLAALLDKTLVCTVKDGPCTVNESRENDFASFSQQANLTARSSFEGGASSISEIVNLPSGFCFTGSATTFMDLRPFKDYTLREQEISQRNRQASLENRIRK